MFKFSFFIPWGLSLNTQFCYSILCLLTNDCSSRTVLNFFQPIQFWSTESLSCSSYCDSSFCFTPRITSLYFFSHSVSFFFVQWLEELPAMLNIWQIGSSAFTRDLPNDHFVVGKSTPCNACSMGFRLGFCFGNAS